MRNRQAELVKNLSDRELLINVYLTQGILLILSCVIGAILFSEIWFIDELVEINLIDIIFLGGGLALLIILIDQFLMKVLPEDKLDDGGINERIFSNLSVPHILFLSFIISFSEELMFRGVIQTHLGLYIASGLFAIIHVRYLAKPVLFTLVVGVSFSLGILFELTDNVLVTITAHFLIDSTMGILIKQKAHS
ncbi:CPBP family intramembrane glutamic endopeptidase [Pseudalkalibacillus hwajinpoensis]|uniref:CPBP family intramembrane metalloprotease n=1 Tax=Guptibacillus hwajinpoensis TaxID=208199 RepID=A0A4U1MHF1_9BACL|nr:CPBP family intramembrane glutamic endopeptidase [Pseudalkalibacillus hwajinpoensis]TKD69884.1 CPBP family intramembrane metalloprotease [Pseudalkalibacillus hwajinpoensis]